VETDNLLVATDPWVIRIVGCLELGGWDKGLQASQHISSLHSFGLVKKDAEDAAD
jgi:hypothetical protein